MNGGPGTRRTARGRVSRPARLGDWGEFGHFELIELTEDERRRGWEATDVSL